MEPGTSPSIDQLLEAKRRIEQVLENQPRRKRQLAKQLADIQRQIDALQGQRTLL